MFLKSHPASQFHQSRNYERTNDHEYQLDDLALFPFAPDRILNFIVNEPLCISAGPLPISFEYTPSVPNLPIYAAPFLSQISSPLRQVASSRWSERQSVQEPKKSLPP